jgi:hypothetical protein
VIEIEGHHDLTPIGAGGLGVVYRAIRSSDGSPVAIKVLRQVSDHSAAWHRARRELTALMALSGHPHVVQLIELLELDTGPALVMEYVPGGSVAELLAERSRPLATPEAVLIARHTARALIDAHAHAIVHRDVKPQNLLIDGTGHVKLCDFGIAALTGTDAFRSATRAWSPRYASPEDLDDELGVDVDPATDVYSLGATLLHLVHGAPPTLRQRLDDWTPPPTGDRGRASFDEVLAACLRVDPLARPSARELIERLDHVDATDGTVIGALPVGRSTRAVMPVDGHSAVIRFPPPAAADPTVVRPGVSDPVTVARPARSRKRVRRPLATGIAALSVAMIVGIVVTVARGGADAVSPATSGTRVRDGGRSRIGTVAGSTVTVQAPIRRITVVERPEGLVDIVDVRITWPFGMVGECLVQQVGDERLRPVPCDQPHDLQRVSAGDLGDANWSSATFDEDAVRVAVDRECAAAFVPFAAADVPGDGAGDLVVVELDLAVTRPSAAAWLANDRRFQCFLGAPGHRLIGDARDVI